MMTSSVSLASVSGPEALLGRVLDLLGSRVKGLSCVSPCLALLTVPFPLLSLETAC